MAADLHRPGAGDEFGNSVGVSGKLAVVGARYEDGGPGDPYSQAGAAYLFQELSGP
ncbi:MAG: FG-GAP repeat protein, partial [Acidimicrobiales bacterium]